MSTSGSERDDDRTEAHPEPPSEPGGVLGNLPRKRPAVRSPDRPPRQPDRTRRPQTPCNGSDDLKFRALGANSIPKLERRIDIVEEALTRV